jgi:poly-gamma-glutamate system protein
MKKIYWRPTQIPRVILLVSVILAIASISSVELITVQKKRPYYSRKFQAALAMKNGMETIKDYRLKLSSPIDSEFDPADSGMIGLPESPITSKAGQLAAKQHTINPNWAAVVVEMYKDAGLKKGDTVAMGFSGSFPALNLAAIVAAEALKLNVVAITSVAASTWGANIPNFTWLDMERLLYKEGIIKHTSVAASLGGLEDIALGKSKKKRAILASAIERNGLKPLEFETTSEHIEERMSLYWEFAGESRIAAYVNVGGSLGSIGTKAVKTLFKPGLNINPPQEVLGVDGVITRFAREGLPVINLVYIEKLAKQYGLPESPQTIPPVGEGQLYSKVGYNLYLTAVNLFILIIVLYAFLRLDIGYRIFGSSRTTQPPKHPEPMV